MASTLKNAAAFYLRLQTQQPVPNFAAALIGAVCVQLQLRRTGVVRRRTSTLVSTSTC
jgi:hypothetical protein